MLQLPMSSRCWVGVDARVLVLFFLRTPLDLIIPCKMEGDVFRAFTANSHSQGLASSREINPKRTQMRCAL